MQNTKYQSEEMQFINTLLNKPGNHKKQMELRSTGRDQDFIDRDEQQSYADSEIKHNSYVYFSYSKADGK